MANNFFFQFFVAVLLLVLEVKYETTHISPRHRNINVLFIYLRAAYDRKRQNWFHSLYKVLFVV